MSIVADVYKTAQPYPLVFMIDVDLSPFGGSVYHFTPSLNRGGSFAFGGVTYSAFPIVMNGFEINSEGNLPQPTLTVGAVENKILAAAMGSYGDLVGMKITRRKTYSNYLDGEVDEDSTQHSFVERFVASQLIERSKSQISWKLVTPLDLPNMIIPGLQYLKDPTTYNVYAPGLSRILSS